MSQPRHIVGVSHNSDRELQSVGNLQLARDQQTGLIVGKSFDSINESASYNSFGEVTGRSISGGVGSEVYVRDDLGRVVERSTNIGGIVETSNYLYDPAGQLVRVIRSGPFSSDVRYSYDARGNRLSVNRDGAVTTSTYDNADRLLTSGDLRFSYTAHGDLLEKENIVTGEKLTLTYDERGQLTRATLPNGTIVQYAIDGEGKRIAKAVNGAMTVGYMHDLDGRLVAEVNSNGSLRSHFIYVSQTHSPDYMIRGGTRYFFAKDHLGSIKAVVNVNTGVTEQVLHYDEFGRVLSDSNPGFQPFGFAGGHYDHQTGLVRFGARDYDAEIGRWTAKDTILFERDDTNLYRYTKNDPINLLDPDGNRPVVPRPPPPPPPRPRPPFNPPRWVTQPNAPSVPLPVPRPPSDQGPIDRPDVEFLLCLIKGNCPPPKLPPGPTPPGPRKCTPGNPSGRAPVSPGTVGPG